MENEKTVEVLNTLITINNDRIEGYETASKETEEQDLKNLFGQFIATSQKCRQELVLEVAALDGEIAEGTLTSGKFFRVWMDVKAALTGKDRKAILNSCEYGEDAALATYKEALEDYTGLLNTKQQSMISHQQSLIKADHNKVKAMRDALVEI
ncbi:ferritin-like domain-containing protein [Flavobacterium sp. N1994]|uniref:ferritin-like domain-containing protein n=1 Tax=Flavobacterium sp. N1994 TaxID=2986827 RepID=UPI002221E5F2|nr:PA2169 family four-helix-bundle protein [Flavobacterium sp. N1994]